MPAGSGLSLLADVADRERRDGFSQFVVRRKHSVVAVPVLPRRRDEIGEKAVENSRHLRDLHATILHLAGLDHRRLTYRFNGRDFRLTDVASVVVDDVTA